MLLVAKKKKNNELMLTEEVYEILTIVLLIIGGHWNLRANILWLTKYGRITRHMNQKRFLFYINGENKKTKKNSLH